MTGSLESYVYADPSNHRDAAPAPTVVIVATGDRAAVDLVRALDRGAEWGPVVGLVRQLRRQLRRIPRGQYALAFLRHLGPGPDALESTSNVVDRALDVVAAMIPGQYDQARALLAAMDREERIQLHRVAAELSTLVVEAANQAEVYRP